MADETRKPEDEQPRDEEDKVEEILDDRQPQELSDEEVEQIAEAPPDPTEYPEGQAEEMQERLEEGEREPTVVEEAVVEAVETTEQLSETAPAETFGRGVTAVQETIEAAGGPPETVREAQADAHHHGDTTVILGREYPVPVYTSVFIALGVLTVLEVTIAELIPGDIKIPLLLGIGIAKSLLVVIFYMHLNTDSRLFALTLAAPVFFAVLITFFLLAVPTG
jgi:caa(3)-type oxidase subunit IV